MLKENEIHTNKQSQKIKSCDCFNFKSNYNNFAKELKAEFIKNTDYNYSAQNNNNLSKVNTIEVQV